MMGTVAPSPATTNELSDKTDQQCFAMILDELRSLRAEMIPLLELAAIAEVMPEVKAYMAIGRAKLARRIR